MTDIAHSIDLNPPQKLQDQDYRRKFFWAESSAGIAAQLIALRKRRGLNQKEVAEITGTKQPAISRAQQADYQNWNLNTLRSIADALDARVRVLIEPAEDVLKEYDSDGASAVQQAQPANELAIGACDQPYFSSNLNPADGAMITSMAGGTAVAIYKVPSMLGFAEPQNLAWLNISTFETPAFAGPRTIMTDSFIANATPQNHITTIARLQALLAEKNKRITALESEVSTLRAARDEDAGGLGAILYPQSQRATLRMGAKEFVL